MHRLEIDCVLFDVKAPDSILPYIDDLITFPRFQGHTYMYLMHKAARVVVSHIWKLYKCKLCALIL